ncbi:hypothetical protein HG530_014104 [Fusarium avenaceum]|nr:hypothetical protein HG530_014104 [Fusarium avenaceum]
MERGCFFFFLESGCGARVDSLYANIFSLDSDLLFGLNRFLKSHIAVDVVVRFIVFVQLEVGKGVNLTVSTCWRKFLFIFHLFIFHVVGFQPFVFQLFNFKMVVFRLLVFRQLDF